mmetsp:Transcript_22832/g.90526  ORF Transcript_22832/g.90526 Transcript_22832/m.90526 type:complete len:229 (+) Transcript_22832:60-746(+)
MPPRVVVAPLAAVVTAVVALTWWSRRRRRREEDPPARGRPPSVVIVFSGKRKSGKDYCADALLAAFPPTTAEIGRLSGPLKRAYARERGLDYDALLGATAYKERYRADMIAWGEARRAADPGYFARLVLAEATAPVLIVSDARRRTDLDYFFDVASATRVLTVRVEAADGTRAARGWVFAVGVDDAESECGLDDYAAWDVVIANEPERAADTAARIAEIARLALASLS